MQTQLQLLESENEMLQDEIYQMREKRSVVQRHLCEVTIVNQGT